MPGGTLMHRIIASLLVFATFAVAPLASSAAPITVPTDLNVGDQYRLAFVTSTTRNATSFTLSDYNDFVTEAAESVTELLALGTTWKAIGSTATVDARDNTGTNPSDASAKVFEAYAQHKTPGAYRIRAPPQSQQNGIGRPQSAELQARLLDNYETKCLNAKARVGLRLTPGA